jgi:hypothetical protein
MALIDPPDYVAIDPILIYEVNDLPPEIYHRLLQLIGWLWVTRRNGKPLAVTIGELAERWEVAERTAYHTLQTLGAAGYLTIHFSRGRTDLERGPRITDVPQAARGGDHTPGEPATDVPQAARGGDHRPREAVTEHNLCAMSLHERGDICATPLHKGPNSYGVVDPGSSGQQQQTINPAVQCRCTEAGIWPERACELAADPWVTEERVRLTVQHFQAKQRRGEPVGGRPIQDVAALAWDSLRNHREPPGEDPGSDYWRQFVEENNRRRFIEGPYADSIQH